MTLCVYAITAAPCAPVVSGVRLHSVGSGRVWATTALVRRPPALTSASLRRYERTITAIADTSPAVLPVRFGTLMDETEVLAVLRSRRTALTAALRQVRGHVQMTVRLIEPPLPPDETARAVVARSGRAYLTARADAVTSRGIPGFASVRELLGPWVRDERVERAGGVTSIYHLVHRRAAGRYRRAVVDALDAAGLRAVVTGPFPPYAFTSW